MTNNLKNLKRIRQVFSNLKQRKPEQFSWFCLVCPTFSDFLSEDGQKLFERKGEKVYLKTAKSYWKILNNK